MLDLITPSEGELCRAVYKLDAILKEAQPVLVHCALGLSRSVLVVAGWLLYNGTANTVEQAVSCIGRARPDIVISKHQPLALASFFEKHTLNI